MCERVAEVEPTAADGIGGRGLLCDPGHQDPAVLLGRLAVRSHRLSDFGDGVDEGRRWRKTEDHHDRQGLGDDQADDDEPQRLSEQGQRRESPHDVRDTLGVKM
jgi:hypothetical protein